MCHEVLDFALILLCNSLTDQIIANVRLYVDLLIFDSLYLKDVCLIPGQFFIQTWLKDHRPDSLGGNKSNIEHLFLSIISFLVLCLFLYE